MKILDISLPLSPHTPHWPTDTSTRLWQTSCIADGAHSNDTHMETSLHAGTHYDAPLHFLPEGKSIDKIDLSVFMGPTYLAHMPKVKSISEHDLEKLRLPKGTSRILFKTANSKRWGSNDAEFNKEYVGLTAGAAQWLVKNKIKLVGIDYLSVAAFDEIVPVHKTLLGKGIAILEGLDLRKAKEGKYELIAFPLLIPGSEASLVRAVLLTK
ncbi:MAG: cyclase family protein [bacterium]|nr:cyclase family protein [bacterium]MDO8742386.1 cyclase family protein [bacterium]